MLNTGMPLCKKVENYQFFHPSSTGVSNLLIQVRYFFTSATFLPYNKGRVLIYRSVR